MHNINKIFQLNFHTVLSLKNLCLFKYVFGVYRDSPKHLTSGRIIWRILLLYRLLCRHSVHLFTLYRFHLSLYPSLRSNCLDFIFDNFLVITLNEDPVVYLKDTPYYGTNQHLTCLKLLSFIRPQVSRRS